ncbi:MAG: hypothetical protein NVSMB57_07690 [Actinomycetota bacterium]
MLRFGGLNISRAEGHIVAALPQAQRKRTRDPAGSKHPYLHANPFDVATRAVRKRTLIRLESPREITRWGACCGVAGAELMHLKPVGFDNAGQIPRSSVVECAPGPNSHT